MKYSVSFTAWYLNFDRIWQLLNPLELAEHFARLEGVTGRAYMNSSIGIARLMIKQKLEEWLHCNAVRSLGESIVTHNLKPGDLFTIYQDFYGRGLSKYAGIPGDLPRDAVAELYNTLKYDSKRTIRIRFSPSNLISSTAWNRLGGHTKLFCFCYVESLSDGEIVGSPYLIGDIHTGLELETPGSWDGHKYGEVHVARIDQFDKIAEVFQSERKAPDLKLLEKIAEADVKGAIAEIIHENNPPKDWGGETSDLFSTNLSIERKFLPSAFLFKGPARFSEMKMTHLGKNGDQIMRLFTEPADLLILQHCHKVSNPVRSTMRAFASRIHDLRYFSIIDGYDTVRLLQAYQKCGF